MPRRALVIDLGIALVVLALTLGLLAGGGADGRGEDARSLDPLGGLLAALASLPLVGRRRAPLAVFAVTAAASATLNGLGHPLGPPFGPTVALYSVAAGQEQRRGRMWLVSAVVLGLFIVHVGAVGFAEDEFPTVALLFGALVWGGAWVVGERTRLRRDRIAQLEERAVRAEREAERERRLAAAEERMRIARDLHDSAGHAINVILVQAGAARLLQQQDPARARAALETIEDVARETIDEIDQLVRALREDSAVEAPVEIEPPPGLAALETLAERQRSAGLAVDVDVRGQRRPLPAGVDRAAYRILQEALTNAARHGRGSAQVELDFGANELEITVTNPTGADGAAATGHGIAGMRERAALLGGTVEAGARDGLFRVRARLPYGAERA